MVKPLLVDIIQCNWIVWKSSYKKNTHKKVLFYQENAPAHASAVVWAGLFDDHMVGPFLGLLTTIRKNI